MEWMQVLTIVVTLLGVVFYIHSDVKDIKREIQQQSVRTDRLYEIVIDLIKEKNRA